MGKPQQIRDHIAYFLQEAVKAYEIDGVCDRLGMPVVEGAWTYNSKRVYVQNRLAGVPASELLQIAQRVVEEFDDPELEQLLEGGGFRGVDGKLKNIIFTADGAKPRIVISDALNNMIDIVEGAERCLIYDRPLPSRGLTWGELVHWWALLRSISNERDGARSLYLRLSRSLASPPEKLLFKTLHYSPYTARELAAMNGTELLRQRMDFLLLPGEPRASSSRSTASSTTPPTTTAHLLCATRKWCARTARSDSLATRFSASAAASCKAQQASILYASSSTNSSSARNDNRKT